MGPAKLQPTSSPPPHQKSRRAFTLIELLIVVAIISILSAIALINFSLAKHRAQQAKCASNLKAICYALAAYRIDENHYPLADGIAGTQESMGQTQVGNGPAANGSWDGVPRILVSRRYLTSDQYLFCPVYADWFRGDRLQKYRYAYNSAAVDTGGFLGGANHLEQGSGDIWFARCCWVPREKSFTTTAGDMKYPHGEDYDRENALMTDSRIELRDGRSDFARQ